MIEQTTLKAYLKLKDEERDAKARVKAARMDITTRLQVGELVQPGKLRAKLKTGRAVAYKRVLDFAMTFLSGSKLGAVRRKLNAGVTEYEFADIR